MIGLYYPFIHFRDENWLKLALIYWSKIARIVPDSYATHDSADVRRVNDELGAVVNSPPFSAGNEIAEDFMAFVQANAGALRKKYDISLSDKWKDDPYTASRAPEGTDPKFGYIYHEKFGGPLKDLLVQENLAVWGEGRGRSRDLRWIGVHPDIAGVYMAGMAESIAAHCGYTLLADELTQHVVIGDRSVDRLAELLLKRRFEAPPVSFVTPEAVAVIALQTVLPRDLCAVPMKKIIELRKKYPAELADFQKWVHGAAKSLSDSTGGVKSPSAMNEHLTVLEQQEIQPRLKVLREQLRSLSIETVTGALSLKSPWNVSGAMAAYYFSNPALVVGGVALTAIPNLGKQRREAQKAVAGNFAAYLLNAQERLTPRSLMARFGTAWRRLSLGV